jgi:hypothetical protein
MSTIEQNAQIIEADLQWLQTVIENRIQQFINHENPGVPAELAPPALETGDAVFFYAGFVQKHGLTPEERLIVLLALAPEVQPELLDVLLVRNGMYDKAFSEFGGVATGSFNGFIPTLKTALFVLGGSRLSGQMKYAALLDKTGKLYTARILTEIKTETGNPVCQSPLKLSDSALSYILSGEDVRYEYGADFPARELTTMMDWNDLVLHESTALQLQEILLWPEWGQKLLGDLEMARNIQPGYRALFYGPSGTGKTITTALLGKKVNKPVYRIDLSQLVSKYIGETEKNLEKIFTAAENRDWILFFDEADALFGKRTAIGSSNDRFANQETSYLLQRIELCNNIVILATNLKTNLDEAYTRRFQSIVYFPIPAEEERFRLWQGAFSHHVSFDEAIDFKVIAKKYDISGGSIVNVVRYATLMAVARGTLEISRDDLFDGVKREYAKLGRTLA